MKSYFFYILWIKLLACTAKRAAQTHKAEELETPAAGGTFPSIKISRPTNSDAGIYLTPALYPALKYFT